MPSAALIGVAGGRRRPGRPDPTSCRPTSMPLKRPQWPSENGIGPASTAAETGSTATPMASPRVASKVPSAATLRWTLIAGPTGELEDHVAFRPGQQGQRTAVAGGAGERTDLDVADLRVAGLEGRGGEGAGALAVLGPEGEAGREQGRRRGSGASLGAALAGDALVVGALAGDRWPVAGRRLPVAAGEPEHATSRLATARMAMDAVTERSGRFMAPGRRADRPGFAR